MYLGMWILCCGIIGALIAHAANAPLWPGFCWGVALGPIGWVIAAFMMKPQAAAAHPIAIVPNKSDFAERLARARAAAKAAQAEGTVMRALQSASIAPHAEMIPQADESNPYDHLGVAGDFPLDRIEDAISRSEIVSVAYFGGRHPGTVREIGPKSIDDDMVEALCVASGEIQTYRLSRMAVPHGPAHRAYLIVLSDALRTAAG